jgi:hypothetical protein
MLLALGVTALSAAFLLVCLRTFVELATAAARQSCQQNGPDHL